MPNTREKPIGRLTLPHYGGKGHYMKCSEQFSCSGECADCEELDEIVERLAYYEDMIANGVIISKTETVATDNNKWIPVTERLPEDDLPNGSNVKQIKVLAVLKSWNGIQTVRSQMRYRDTWGKEIKWMWKYSSSEVTHWMPLPEPPKGE